MGGWGVGGGGGGNNSEINQKILTQHWVNDP